jgi:hypothetical protein
MIEQRFKPLVEGVVTQLSGHNDLSTVPIAGGEDPALSPSTPGNNV